MRCTTQGCEGLATELFEGGSWTLRCPVCGKSDAIDPPRQPDAADTAAARARARLLARDYDGAERLFLKAAAEAGTGTRVDAFALWALCARYGLRFVREVYYPNDPARRRSVFHPTLGRFPLPDYDAGASEAARLLASSGAAHDLVGRLDALVRQAGAHMTDADWYFDVFIAWHDGPGSDACQRFAALLREQLLKLRIYPFVSFVDLADVSVHDYEPAIYAALAKAGALAVVVDDYDALGERFLAAELERFESRMASDQSLFHYFCGMAGHTGQVPAKFRGWQLHRQDLECNKFAAEAVARAIAGRIKQARAAAAAQKAAGHGGTAATATAGAATAVASVAGSPGSGSVANQATAPITETGAAGSTASTASTGPGSAAAAPAGTAAEPAQAPSGTGARRNVHVLPKPSGELRAFIYEDGLLVLTEGGLAAPRADKRLKRTQRVPTHAERLPISEQVRSVEIDGAVAPTSLERWFQGQDRLVSADLTNLRLDFARSTERMFEGCSHLREVKLPVGSPSALADVSRMFLDCSALERVDLSGFDLSHVLTMQGMFAGCTSLHSVNLTGVDTSGAINMHSLFDRCASLEALDLHALDTHGVTNMALMFAGCGSLKELDLSGFKTSNVTNMGFMFDGCACLATLRLDGFDTTRVTGMRSMFRGCKALATLDLSSFATPSLDDMAAMFAGCTALRRLDVRSLDTRAATGLDTAFEGCDALTDVRATDAGIQKATA